MTERTPDIFEFAMPPVKGPDGSYEVILYRVSVGRGKLLAMLAPVRNDTRLVRLALESYVTTGRTVVDLNSKSDVMRFEITDAAETGPDGEPDGCCNVTATYIPAERDGRSGRKSVVSGRCASRQVVRQI